MNIALIWDTSILALEGKHFHIIVFITIGLDFCVRTLLNALLNVWYVVALTSHLCLGIFEVMLGRFSSWLEFMSRWCFNMCKPLAGAQFMHILWTHNSTFLWVLIMISMMIRGGGHFKNTYEVENPRAFKISMLYENRIFQCMGKIFCVAFQRFPLKFHPKYLIHPLKDVHFIHRWKFKSS